MIGALHLALVIAVPMQTTASEAALSMRAHERESHVSSQFFVPRGTPATDETDEYEYVHEYEYVNDHSLGQRPRTRTRIAYTYTFVSTQDEWFGNDKLRHFLMSMAVTQFTYGGLRTASTNDDVALPIAIGVAAVAGVGKELYDVRIDRPFSLKDLAWDAAGIAIAGILLGSVR